jgi:DNA-binding CsgD family transcriptional regulator
VPPGIGAAAEAVVAAQGRRLRLVRTFHRNPVPLAIVDGERRYVEVNDPARLVLRLTLAKLRTLRIEDLTPPSLRPAVETAWERLIGNGALAGPHELAVPDGGRFGVVCYGRANALPGQHVIAFAPIGWAEDALGHLEPGTSVPLTPRELDVLQLAVQGLTGPRIAAELMLSPATVKTHFENIYGRLDVTDRVTAVAKAMRLGLID